MAPRATQVSSSDKAGCMLGSWKGQGFFGLTEWGQGRGTPRFVYALGSLERARLQLVPAENKCSHYLSWKDMLVSEQQQFSAVEGVFLFVSFCISSYFKPKLEDLLKASTRLWNMVSSNLLLVGSVYWPGLCFRDTGKGHLPGRCSPGAKNARGAWKLVFCLEEMLANKTHKLNAVSGGILLKVLLLFLLLTRFYKSV